jgi:hypothetical protein
LASRQSVVFFYLTTNQHPWHTPIFDQAFPELMSFAKNKNITIFKAKETLSPNELYNLPLSEEAFNQLLPQAQILEDLPSLDQDDIWTYDWAAPFYIPIGRG